MHQQRGSALMTSFEILNSHCGKWAIKKNIPTLYRTSMTAVALPWEF